MMYSRLFGVVVFFVLMLTASVQSAPDCTATGDLTDVCAGTTGLTASVPTGIMGTTYLWTISPNGTIIGPGNQPAVAYSADSTGSLTLTIQVTEPSLEECQEDYNFMVYSNPGANILADGVSTSATDACFGVDLSLNGNPSGGSGSYVQHTWSGTGVAFLNNSNTQSPTFNSTVPGNYTLVYTVSDSHSCQGQDSIAISVFNNPVADILVEGVSTASTSICSGIDLSLDGNPAGGSGSYTTHNWTGTGAVHLSNVNIQNPVFNASSGGTYSLTYTVTDSHGCSATDNLSIIADSSPVPNILSSGSSVSSDWLCLGEMTALNGNPGGGSGVYVDHEWTGDIGPLSNTTVQSPTFQTGVQGSYQLFYTVTDANGCIGTDSISIQVENPMADIRANGVSTSTFEVCAGVTVSLNGNPTGGSGSNSHLWTGDTGPLSNRFIRNPNFNTSTPGVYNLVYTVTDNQGCSANDSISITVHPNPVVDILIDGFPLSSDWLCINEPVNLDGNPSGGSNIFVTHLWTGSGASRLNNPNIQMPVFQSPVAGVFTLTYRVTDSRGCVRTDTVTITVANPIPDIEAEGAPVSVLNACSGDGVILNGNPKNGSHVYISHLWTGDTGPLDQTTIQSPVFNTSTLGTYSLVYTVVDDENCIGSDTIVINVVANPIAAAGPDNLILHGESVELDASASSCSGGCTYHWEVVSGDAASIDSGADAAMCSISPEGPTVYQITVTDTGGCTDSDTVVITVGAIPIPTTSYLGVLLLLGAIGIILFRVRFRRGVIEKSFLLFVIAFTVLVSVSSSSAQTIRFVNPASTSPSSPYNSWQNAGHTIQVVIDASANGDTVYVANGVYAENVNLDKDITLLSWCLDPESCIIDAPNASSPAVTISDPDFINHQIVFGGFMIQGGSKAVFLENNASSVQIPQIRNCIIDGYSAIGIHCLNGVFLAEFCTIVNNNVGIQADGTNSRCSASYNIISENAVQGIRINATYFQMKNNCFFNNGLHIFGAPNAYCDEWSLLAMPSGIDPLFMVGSYRLQTSSPCRDFTQINPYNDCNETRFDMDESPFDLGAYGGYGSFPVSPDIDMNSREPEPGDFKIPANVPVSFRIFDQGSAGLDLNSLVVTMQNHGHPMETFIESDLQVSPVPQYGNQPDDCLAMGYDVTLPGSAHGLFSDFANVRISVFVSDRSPTPNSFFHHWEFFADDLNPPVLQPGYYPSNGAINVPLYGPIEMDINDAGVGYDPDSMFFTLNGNPLSLNLSEVTWSGNHLTVIPRPRFIPGQLNVLTFSIADYYGNTMPVQTISFTCSNDTDLPFVPGVTGPLPTPGDPALAPSPVPAPGSNEADIGDPITFYFQDFSTIVDLMNMEVAITNGSNTYRYYFESHGGTSRVFQVSGDPQSRLIRCYPSGGWIINTPITVTITGGTDTASSSNTMLPAIYQFQCSSAPLPSTSTWGMIVLLLAFGGIIIIRRR